MLCAQEEFRLFNSRQIGYTLLRVCLVLILISVPKHLKAQSFEDKYQLADSLLEEDDFERVSQLLHELESEASSGQKFLVYKLWGDFYLSQSQSTLAVEAYKKVEQQAVPTSKEYLLQYARAVNDLGIAHYRNSDIFSAKDAHFRSLKLYSKHNDAKGYVYNYNNLGILYKELKELDSAIWAYEEGLKAADRTGEAEDLAFLYTNLGGIYVDNQNRPKGIDYFLKALNLFIEIEDMRMVNRLKVMLSVHYRKLGDVDKSKQYLEEARDYFIQEQDHVNLVRVYLRFIEWHFKEEDYQQAEAYIKLAEAELQYVDNQLLKSIIITKRGYLNYKKEDFLPAKSHFQQALVLLEGSGFKSHIAHNLIGLANIEVKENNYAKARSLVQQAYDLVGNKMNESDLKDYYFLMAETAEKLGNYKEGLSYFRQYSLVNDSLELIRQRGEIERIEYQLAQERMREQDRLKQEQLLNIEKQKADEQQVQLFFAVLLILILSVAVILIYRSALVRRQLASKNLKYAQELKTQHSIVQAQNIELIDINKELEELRERDRLLQEKEKALLQDNLEAKDRELAASTLASVENTQAMQALQDQLILLAQEAQNPEVQSELEKLNKELGRNLNLETNWTGFVRQFEKVHPRFFKALRVRHNNLTQNDLKILAYLKIGLSNKEIATAIRIEPDSVKKSTTRIKKKLNLEPELTLRDYINQLD